MPKNHYTNLLFVSLLVLLHSAVAAADDNLQRTWTLYHSMNPKLGDAGFTQRGTVTLQVATDDGDAAQLTAENTALTAENVATMMASGWYQVKLVENGSSSAAVPVMTTVPACQLRRANFRDEIALAFGQQGHVISIAYSPLVSPLAPKTCDDLEAPSDDDEPIQFTTKMEYETAVPGMSLKTILPSYQPPPGLKFIPGSSSNKHKGGGGAGGGGGDAKPDGFQQGTPEAEPPSSIMGFLQRYWYIILPIVVMNMLQADPAEPRHDNLGQQGGGSGAAQGGQAAVPAAGGAAPKRRGKRG